LIAAIIRLEIEILLLSCLSKTKTLRRNILYQ